MDREAEMVNQLMQRQTRNEAEKRNPQVEREINTRVVQMAKETLTKEFRDAKANAELVKKELQKIKEETAQQSESSPQAVSNLERIKPQAAEVAKVVQNTIMAIRIGNVEIKPGNSHRTLTALANAIKPVFINENTAPYIYDLIERGINGRLSTVDQLIEAAEGINNLQYADPILYYGIRSKLHEEARNMDDATPEKLKKLNGEGEQSIESQIENLSRTDQDYRTVIGRTPEKKHQELITAIFLAQSDKPAMFERYIKGLAAEMGLDLTDTKTDEATLKNRREKCIALSRELKFRIINLFGQLYQQVDEGADIVTWEEGEQKGGFYTNIKLASEVLRTKVQNLRKVRFTDDSVFSKLPWFMDEDDSIDMEMPVKGMFDGKATKYEARRIPLPVTKAVEVRNHDEYFLSVLEQTENEILRRKFFHNALTLFRNPPPHEGNYFQQLAGYATTLLAAKDIDTLWSLPDSEKFMASSQLLHKLDKVEYAAYDWRHQAATTESPNTRLKRHEEQTLAYIRKMFPELRLDEWRAKRALVMAKGDLYSLELGALEDGAWADPPSIAGKKTHVSYGDMSAAPYMAFNMLAHTGLRFDSQDLTMGNLLFMPIMGSEKALGKGSWDHKSLNEDMKRAMDAFVKGKYQSDVENGIVRMIDLVNYGKVGSLYSRAGWRLEPAYEGLLKVHPRGPDTKSQDAIKEPIYDITESWKAVECVGLEILKDFLGKINNYDSTFYKSDGTDKRRVLYGYLSKRYELKDTFESLEADPAKLEDAYKKFYWKVIGKATVERAPMIFLTSGSERTRFTAEGNTPDGKVRKRSWEMVQEATKYGREDFMTAVKDVCAAETELRSEISKEMKDALAKKGNLHDFDSSGYVLKEDNLRRYLNQMIEGSGPQKEARVEKAVQVFKKTKEFTAAVVSKKPDGTPVTFLTEFTDKWTKGSPHMPFAVLTEEIDRSFLAHRGMGSDAERRAIGDIAGNEANVAGSIGKLLDAMRKTSLSGKHDYGELVNLIGTVHKQMRGAIGFGAAVEMSHHLAALCINFFKKDTTAKLVLGVGGIGRINSLAGEFAGRSTAVWEWDSKDIDGFLVELSKNNIIPKNAKELQKIQNEEEKESTILGKKIRYKAMKPDFPITEETMRNEFGAAAKNIVFDMVNKYALIAIGAVLYYFIKKALEEASGKKK